MCFNLREMLPISSTVSKIKIIVPIHFVSWYLRSSKGTYWMFNRRLNIFLCTRTCTSNIFQPSPLLRYNPRHTLYIPVVYCGVTCISLIGIINRRRSNKIWVLTLFRDVGHAAILMILNFVHVANCALQTQICFCLSMWNRALVCFLGLINETMGWTMIDTLHAYFSSRFHWSRCRWIICRTGPAYLLHAMSGDYLWSAADSGRRWWRVVQCSKCILKITVKFLQNPLNVFIGYATPLFSVTKKVQVEVKAGKIITTSSLTSAWILRSCTTRYARTSTFYYIYSMFLLTRVSSSKPDFVTSEAGKIIRTK